MKVASQRIKGMKLEKARAQSVVVSQVLDILLSIFVLDFPIGVKIKIDC